jgi:hypothetical protein
VIEMSEEQDEIVTYQIGRDGKVRPIARKKDGSLYVQETVVDEGY